MKLLSLLASLSIVLALVGLEASDITPRNERPTARCSLTGTYDTQRHETIIDSGCRHIRPLPTW